MKKIFLIFPALTVMLLFACQKTPDVHITVNEKAKNMTVEAPAGFVWGEDERIVVNGMKSSLTELDMETIRGSHFHLTLEWRCLIAPSIQCQCLIPGLRRTRPLR